MIEKYIPSICIFCLLILIPLGYSEEVLDNSLLPKYISLSVFLLLFLSYYFKRFIQHSLSVSITSVLLLAYVLLSLPNIFFSLNASEAIYENSKIVLFAMVFFIGLFLVKNNREQTLNGVATFSNIALILAIFFSLEELFEALRLREPLSASAYLVKGLHGHKNLLTSWLMLLIPLSAIGLFIKTKFPKILIWFSLIAAAAFLFILQTRAVFVGLTLGGIVFILIKLLSKNKRAPQLLKTFLYGLLGVFGVIILITLFTTIPENFLASFNPGSGSSGERLTLWSRTIPMIKENSFWGVGGGNWKFIFPKQGLSGLYRAELNNVIFLRPHNEILWIWSQQGLLSLLAYLGFIFSILLGAAKVVFKKDNLNVSALWYAGIFAYLGMSFFDFPMERIEHSIVFALTLALLASNINTEPTYKLAKEIRLTGISLAIGSLVFFCFMGVVRFQSESHIRKMLVYKDQGNNELILKEANEVNEHFKQTDNNTFPIAWYKGNACYNLGRQNEAIQYYNEAMEVSPYNFNVLNNAGTGFLLKKEYQQAIPYYLEAVRINPSSEGSKLNLISAYVSLSNWVEAKKWHATLRTKTERSEKFKQMISANLNQ